MCTKVTLKNEVFGWSKISRKNGYRMTEKQKTRWRREEKKNESKRGSG